ncbi:MAG: hypothetical protein PHO26_00335 [Dehalococcoidia bacterium]|nr:hypothetical protein [Dehalococcoidia bacterium]MDD5493845.1 hypothetical protein [Dehalococcoidia bacterium]
MSKKKRKKLAQKNLSGTAGTGAKLAGNQPAFKSAAKAPVAAAGKLYMSSEDLDKRYQYIKHDLKTVAIIAIPMILGLIIASFFIKF